MNKKLLIAAVGMALVAGPMMAHAAATVYGSLHMSVDNIDSGDTANTAGPGSQRGYISSNSSRFGFKGDEDLGGGLKTIYQMESGAFAMDTGASGLGGTLRNTFMGMTGGWGTVKVGRYDTPFKDLGRKLDNFNEQVGDARNIIGSGGVSNWANWDARVSNMIRYESPNFSGAQVNVLYGTAEGGTPSAGVAATVASGTTAAIPDPVAGVAGDVVSMNLLYSSGPMFLGLAYEKHGTTTNKQETGLRLAGSYDIDALTIGLFYETLSDLQGTASSDLKTMGLMASYKMGNNKIKFHTYKADELKNAPNTGGALMAIGVDHAFSKTASMYVNYATGDNDTNASFVNVASNNGGHGNGVPLGAADKDPKGYSVGMIVKF